MESANYQSVAGVIQNITGGEHCCTQTVFLMTDDGTVNIIVSARTTVIDNVRLRRGMRIAAFYDKTEPMPAIYPPQYQAEVITELRRNQNAALKYFDENLVSEDNSLKLNLTPFTNIVTANGQRFLCSPGNADLLVYYTNATFSIPAQVTPQKVIVMCPFD